MKAFAPFVISTVVLAAFVSYAEEKPAAKPEEKKPTKTLKVTKSEDEWRKLLTHEPSRVARKAGTERAHGAEYEKFNAQGEGTYYCVCCAAELFTSSEKFHSGCGWPSFYDQSKAKNIEEKKDLSAGMVRIEVVCKVCDAHLGHVFEGEGFKTPTDRRYCINGVAMTFVEKGGKPPAPKGKPAEEEKQ